MGIRSNKILIILVPVAMVLIVVLVIGWNQFFRATEVPQVKEIPITAESIQPAGEGLWLVSPEVLDRVPGTRKSRSARLKNLRVQKIEVEVIHETRNQVVIRSPDLSASDLLLQRPGDLTDKMAVVPRGLDEEKLLRLTIAAGLAGLRDRDLVQSMRFISPAYRDSWGFNHFFIGELLKRAYREFDDLRLELAAEPEIRIEGDRALVPAKVRLTALYQGRRNFLLGDEKDYNTLVFQFEQAPLGWKVTNLKGLRPLGFEERFFRLLGGDIGLPLSEAERRDKQTACMPCRDRMAERFGPR